MPTYLDCFNTAFENYQKQSRRSGYVFGFFSQMRHSKKLYAHIEALKIELQTDHVGCAKSILINYFRSEKTKFNNHSFAIYFLDALVNAFPGEQWEIFYPIEKSLVFYTGVVYRGTMQHPESALEHGISSSASDSIEKFAYHTNGGVGVSTSKDQRVAFQYKYKQVETPRSVVILQGYVYKINYRGIGGIDISETLKARNALKTAEIASYKSEVNVIGRIPPEDIMGYWDERNVYHENPRYVPDRELQQTNTTRERLDILFQAKSR